MTEATSWLALDAPIQTSRSVSLMNIIVTVTRAFASRLKIFYRPDATFPSAIKLWAVPGLPSIPETALFRAQARNAWRYGVPFCVRRRSHVFCASTRTNDTNCTRFARAGSWRRRARADGLSDRYSRIRKATR
jgi:hypothetical protein